ncbi:MAG: type II secretion system protein [Candidatus Jorgensenbacteria bacterium]|nr:type II secretion system protein [Candidatus Jorgensenbacteria bacterium]
MRKPIFNNKKGFIQHHFSKELYKSGAGFTLVELIVAMGVFVVIVSIAVGVFVNTVRNQRLLTELMAVNNNAGGILEQIAREVRTGYRFCDNLIPPQNPALPCALSDTTLSFTNYRGVNVTYAFDGGNGGAVTRREEGEAFAVPLTAPEVGITYLTFSVNQFDGNGISSDDVCNPWRVTAVMGVRPKSETLADREIRLQTTISSRVFPAEAPNAPEIIIQTCR